MEIWVIEVWVYGQVFSLNPFCGVSFYVGVGKGAGFWGLIGFSNKLFIFYCAIWEKPLSTHTYIFFLLKEVDILFTYKSGGERAELHKTLSDNFNANFNASFFLTPGSCKNNLKLSTVPVQLS